MRILRTENTSEGPRKQDNKGKFWILSDLTYFGVFGFLTYKKMARLASNIVYDMERKHLLAIYRYVEQRVTFSLSQSLLENAMIFMIHAAF